MTRNLDVLVEAHRISAQRVRKGQPSWAYRIPIARLLAESRGTPPTPESVASLHMVIAAALRTGLPAAWLDCRDGAYDRTFDEILDRLEGTDAAYLAGQGDTEDDLYAILDDILTELYDWADIKRVSCGVP